MRVGRRFRGVWGHRLWEQNSSTLCGTLLPLSAILGFVNEPIILQGRRIGATELEQIRQLLAAHPDWSRHRLSLQVATLWHWRNQVGQLKDMAARTLLLKLEQRGWIALPARRQVSPNRMGRPPLPAGVAPGSELPLLGALETLLPLAISEVSTRPDRGARARFESLLRQHHYLGYRGPVGQNLQYLVSDHQGRPLAGALFGAAAWQCADRDRYVGWDAATRAQGLPFIANNARFLIAPWVKVPHLASHVLGRIAQRLSRDWQRKYGHPIYLLETFVQRDRFAGTCYQAANWRRVGQTKGRSRQNSPNGQPYRLPIKDVYLYPLHPRFRQQLQGQSVPSSTPKHPLNALNS